MSSYSATTRVVFEAQPEAQGNDAAPPLSEIFEQLAEVGKRVAKAMSLHDLSTASATTPTRS